MPDFYEAADKTTDWACERLYQKQRNFMYPRSPMGMNFDIPTKLWELSLTTLVLKPEQLYAKKMMSKNLWLKYLPVFLLIGGFFQPLAMAQPPQNPQTEPQLLTQGRGVGNSGRGNPGRGNSGRGNPNRGRSGNGSSTQQELINVSIDKREIRDFVERRDYTGYSSLPPGIRRNLARGKPIPPGIAKQRRVPTRLQERLPDYSGYEWRIYGNDLVLVATANGIIAEVLSGILR
ncbi:RcnB family protein [Euhalothece natronophila Z-M001]|uniref:RcnB family protein n=1 Tax=Euhalothece natronophila Z-M001 TaxID=522448 RepID=A0A5B8NLL3_9CHRO|nr:anti-virulence regulator CigR family protein [Euhalothece natronophila]QDZ39145.1 RcnB family protein [Euhalothece natronophila Z-M001]